MPRIRSIKPEFWNDEKLGTEPESIMLTFIALWNFSDDYGVVRSNPTWLKNQIYPYKDKLRIDTFYTWLERLVDLELVVPFIHRGEGFYYIRMFRKHQRVEKPSQARFVQEVDLLSILKEKGYGFNKEKELIKQSGSSRGVVVEGSQQDMEGEIGKGGEEEATAPTLSGTTLNPFLPLEDHATNALKDKNFHEAPYRAGIKPENLPGWLAAFNRELKFRGQLSKQESDYRTHFVRWVVKIPGYLTINPDDYNPMAVPKQEQSQQQRRKL